MDIHLDVPPRIPLGGPPWGPPGPPRSSENRLLFPYLSKPKRRRNRHMEHCVRGVARVACRGVAFAWRCVAWRVVAQLAKR